LRERRYTFEATEAMSAITVGIIPGDAWSSRRDERRRSCPPLCHHVRGLISCRHPPEKIDSEFQAARPLVRTATKKYGPMVKKSSSLSCGIDSPSGVRSCCNSTPEPSVQRPTIRFGFRPPIVPLRWSCSGRRR